MLEDFQKRFRGGGVELLDASGNICAWCDQNSIFVGASWRGIGLGKRLVLWAVKHYGSFQDKSVSQECLKMLQRLEDEGLIKLEVNPSNVYVDDWVFEFDEDDDEDGDFPHRGRHGCGYYERPEDSQQDWAFRATSPHLTTGGAHES